MTASLFKQLFALLLLANLAFAVRFSFQIKEINVQVTRDFIEDDLVLAVASNTGSANLSSNWPLGSVESNDTITWNNLTQEVDVPATAANLSMAFGIANTPDNTEAKMTELVPKFVKGIVDVAAAVPGPQAAPAKLVSIALNFMQGAFKCAGAVVISNVIYDKGTLDALNHGNESCETKTYEMPVTLDCGFQNSSYTVTHCLTRLDAKSAGVNLLPSSVFVLLGLAIAAVVVL